jgi:hypothetical protein
MNTSKMIMKERTFSNIMLRAIAILVIVLMVAPTVPAQILSVSEQNKVPTTPRMEVQQAKADLNSIPMELTPRAGAYPSTINTSDDKLATQYNSQRKIVRTNNNMIHEVHESGNNIFYANSSDNGKTWNVTNISRDNNNQHADPAIATNGTNIYIAYRDNKDLRFRRTTDYGKTWIPALNNQADLIYDGSPGWAPFAHPSSLAANGTWVYIAMIRYDFNWPWDDDVMV